MKLRFQIGVLIAFLLLSSCLRDKELDPVGIGGDFELVDQDGKPYSLSNLSGKVGLLYFGYLHCPEVCPFTLYNLGKAYEKIGSRKKDIRILFVTVDTERDTPETMKNFFSYYPLPVTGLTGSRKQIDQVVKRFGAYYEKEPGEKGNLSNCEYDHSVYTYLIDRKGKVRHLFKYEDKPDWVASLTRRLLAE